MPRYKESRVLVMLFVVKVLLVFGNFLVRLHDVCESVLRLAFGSDPRLHLPNATLSPELTFLLALSLFYISTLTCNTVLLIILHFGDKETTKKKPRTPIPHSCFCITVGIVQN